MMTQKVMFDTLLAAAKKYIDSIMAGYGETDKEIAGFEKNNMGSYSGNAPIDHVLFRKFLRLLDELKHIDLGELLLDVDKRTQYLDVAVDHLIEDKQDRYDDGLLTVDKTIRGAINEVLNKAIDNAEDISILQQKGIYKVVSSLPEKGNANIIYLTPTKGLADKNIKDEFMWIDGKWELIGSTSLDLTEYCKKTELEEVKKLAYAAL